MKFSNVDGGRTVASPGLRGLCPSCGAETLAKCGSKVIWHWSHASKQSCDPWWENETPWHRDWKDRYALEWQEVVHCDSNTGEKHIADVKTKLGLVIEFQNSPMPPEELASREAFYGNMVWIVNAASFVSRFHILSKLPDPASELAKDKVFCGENRGVSRNRPNRHLNWARYWKASEAPRGGELAEIHFLDSASAESVYQGHHLFDWINPRTGWFDAQAPVFLDFGDDSLWRIRRYDSRGLLCVQRFSKEEFVAMSVREVLS